MWKNVHDESGSAPWVNTNQVAMINKSEDGKAILQLADGTAVFTDEDYEELLVDWGVLTLK